MHPVLPHSQPWAKPMSTWASLAGWLLSAPLRAAQRGLRLGPEQQAPGRRGQQAPLGASQCLGQSQGCLMGTLSEGLSEAQLWSPANGTAAGAARTARTSTRTMRGRPSAASLRWKGWTWICARMRGRGQEMKQSSLFYQDLLLFDSPGRRWNSYYGSSVGYHREYWVLHLLLCFLGTGWSAS